MDISRLLADKFPDPGVRETAATIIDACGRGLQEDQTVALIHELAQPSGMSGEDSARYIGSFLSAIGAPDYVSQRFTSWIDAGIAAAMAETAEAAEPGSEAETAVDAVAPIDRTTNPPAPAGPTREQLQQRAAVHQRDLAAAPGSEAWTRYWRGGGQQDYLATLQALEAIPPSPQAGGSQPPPAAEAQETAA